MSTCKVIPFRKPPPSAAELEAYRFMTRRWSDESKRLFFPEHYKLEQERGRSGG
jgi:hypothetical protein